MSSWNKVSYPRIHAYAASFGDDLASQCIHESSVEGETVLDPFVGAGTTALQGLLMNRNVIGYDVDPIACRISRVLTGRFDVGYLTERVERFERQVETLAARLAADETVYRDLEPGHSFQLDSDVYRVPQEKAIGFWFHPSHMAMLSVLRAMAKEQPVPLVRQFFEVVMSSAIVRKWPNTLSYAMDIDHSRPHRPRTLEAQPIAVQRDLVQRVLRNVFRTVVNIQHRLEAIEASVVVGEGDAACLLSGLDAGCVDVVLTSPPYWNAIDYPRAHKFSQWWLEPDRVPLSRAEYLGLRRGVRSRGATLPPVVGVVEALVAEFEGDPQYRGMIRYLVDLGAVIEELYRVCKPGGSVTFVVADNVVRGMVFPVSAIVAEFFAYVGLQEVSVEEREIKRTRRRYPFGINGFPNTMRSEFMVTGRKGA